MPEIISQGMNDRDKIKIELLPELFTEELVVHPHIKLEDLDQKFSFEQNLEKQASEATHEAIE